MWYHWLIISLSLSKASTQRRKGTEGLRRIAKSFGALKDKPGHRVPKGRFRVGPESSRPCWEMFAVTASVCTDNIMRSDLCPCHIRRLGRFPRSKRCSSGGFAQSFRWRQICTSREGVGCRFRKGGWCGWKPSSSSNCWIRAFRVVSLIEIRRTVPCRAVRGNSISVSSTLSTS